MHLEENQKCDLSLDQTRNFNPALQNNLFSHFILILIVHTSEFILHIIVVFFLAYLLFFVFWFLYFLTSNHVFSFLYNFLAN